MRWNEVFSSVDSHVAGQSLRLITFGVPRLAHGTIREQYAEFEDRYDHIRRWLINEPRGSSGLAGAVLLPTMEEQADYGVIFMNGSGYIRMSGHGMIALTTTLIGTGSVPQDGPDTRITFDTYVGPIQARASVDRGDVRNVRFRNVPSFRLIHDLPIEVDGKQVPVDVAFGGNWYAIVRAEDLGLKLTSESSALLAKRGQEIFRTVSNAVDIVHPDDHDLAGLFGVIITGEPESEDATMRNATIYRGGQVDRSPCPTGMAATMACLAADGKLAVGDTFVAESIVDTMLTGRIVVGSDVHGNSAVTVEIAGYGSITGMHQFFIDPNESASNGFLLL